MSDNLDRDRQIANLLEEIRKKNLDASEASAKMTEAVPSSAPPPMPEPSGNQPENPEEEPRPAPRSAFLRRRILGALNAGADQRFEDDPINKNMLAPTIQRGIDIKIEAPAEPEEDDLPRVPDTTLENHPVFTQTFTREVFIPKEQIAAADHGAPPNRTLRQEIAAESYVSAADQKRVLNVKDNMDDNFREFFSNTVVIDRESLVDKLRRQRKIKNFVPVEGALGAPVFEDDEPADEEDVRPLEYRSEEDTGPVLAQLMARRATATMRLVFTALFAVLAATLSLVAQFNALPELLRDPPVFYACHLGLLLLATMINFKAVFVGAGRLLIFKADGGALAGFAVLAAWAEGILRLLSDDTVPQGLYGSVAIVALFFIAWGVWLDTGRVLRDFRLVSGPYEKYASSVLENRDFTQRLTRDVDASDATILLKRRTGFTDHFSAHAGSPAPYLRKVHMVASIALYLALLCGVYLIAVKNASPADVAGAVCGIAVLCAPFAATLAGTLPIFSMHRKLTKLGAAVPGYSAAEEISTTSFVVLEGRELFPKNNVRLHGIKTFERERIDKAILFAASVLVQSCDTMAPMFLNVIQNKTDMLYQADSIEYEAGRGYSFWIGQNRMLLGTRELMRVHDIEIPSRDYEARYTKSNTRDAIYLAVSGRLYALFVISYTANPEVTEALRGFVQEGIGILIHTRDFNITPKRVEQFYKVPVNMVGLVHEDVAAELMEKTEYAAHAPSALTHIGSLTSFVNGITACFKLRAAVRMSAAIELIGLLVGLILGIMLTVIESLPELGIWPLLLFQLIWWLILFISVSMHRY